MPSLNMCVSHSLTKEEAVNRLKGLLTEVKEQFSDKISDLQENWGGDQCSFSFKAMGFSISGTLAITESEVALDGKIPFAALPFKGKIESTVRQRANQLLA